MPITITEQQDMANSLLKLLEAVDPAVILAGGAPRNWYLDEVAKDLDFYIHLPEETSAQTKTRWASLGLHMDKLGHDMEDYESLNGLRSVWEGSFENGQIFQIMIMDAPTYDSVVPNFGTSVCKIWYKNGEMHPTLEFLMSHAFNIMYCLEGTKDKHIDKMKEYFPTYEMAENSQFMHDLLNIDTEGQLILPYLTDKIQNKDNVGVEFQEVL